MYNISLIKKCVTEYLQAQVIIGIISKAEAEKILKDVSDKFSKMSEQELDAFIFKT